MRPKIFALIGLSAVLAGLSSMAQVEIKTNREAADLRIPIAVPPCAAFEPEMKTAATEIAQVLADDLLFSGLFKILPPERYPAGFPGLPLDVKQVNFEPWRAVGADNLVYGLVRQEGKELVCELRLFDTVAKDQLLGQEIRVQADTPRLAAHKFSEEVNSRAPRHPRHRNLRDLLQRRSDRQQGNLRGRL